MTAAEISEVLELPRSTVSLWLKRIGLGKRSRLDPLEPPNRYEPRHAGELVDVTSTSKGKGFQGLIKRHKFSRGPESHGSMNVRQPGAIGATDAARVFKGVRMSGQMGNVRVTARAYKIVRVDPDRNLLLLKGGVPGAKGALVLVRQSTKPVKVAKGPAGKPNTRKV